MSDRIRVVDLEVQAHIGVPDEERAQPQRLLISVEMEVPSFSAAAQGDDLELTVNYHDVVERIKAQLTELGPIKLLETLAQKLADDLLNCFTLEQIKVEIKKFILSETRYVAVEVTRAHRHSDDA